ncbi:MAG: Nramp family divalent metal transporter [Actinomycetota bacterium]|nr:Nramp family divalent metal transporter [Actinomycetota bacterium]
MKGVLRIALGILAAIGGFVDIGDIVFNMAAGATFGYELLWVVVVGVVGIVVYSEMCGRVAAASKRPVFDAVRERLGLGVGLVALVAAEIVNFMTLAAEVGGIAIVLQLLSGLPYRALVPVGLVLLAAAIWFLRFEWIERVFGYAGLCLVVFAVAAIKLEPEWQDVARGFLPQFDTGDPLVYAFFAVGLLGAAMTPYEVYFYSSGAVEEGWTPRDLGVNKANAMIGYGLGGFLSFALMITAGALFLPLGVDPQFLGTVALGAEVPLGQVGLLLALVGMMFAVGGAAIDTCLSGAYSLAQFFGWEWGKYRGAARAPRFTLAWLVLLVLASAVVATGIDAVMLTEYAVVFSAVALPLTYVPILLVANDRSYMGRHANGRLANVAGLVYLLVILVVAVAAVPLLFLTNGGQG